MGLLRCYYLCFFSFVIMGKILETSLCENSINQSTFVWVTVYICSGLAVAWTAVYEVRATLHPGEQYRNSWWW